jgi:PleD family two-component response regulator
MTPRANRKVMVIGFDENFCYLMQRYGRINACKLAIANHDENILAQVLQYQPGVIFLEVAHSVSFAWSLFKEIKNNSETSKIPIIICSWQGAEDDSEHESADYYLRLPILYEHFKCALDQV